MLAWGDGAKKHSTKPFKTHEARVLCDRASLMDRVVVGGGVDEVVENPPQVAITHCYAFQGILGHPNLLHDTLDQSKVPKSSADLPQVLQPTPMYPNLSSPIRRYPHSSKFPDPPQGTLTQPILPKATRHYPNGA